MYSVCFRRMRKVLVEHVMMVKKHVRPNPQRNVKGGIAEQESRLSISNVQLVCATCGPVRIGHEVRGRPQGTGMQKVWHDAGQVVFDRWLFVVGKGSRTGKIARSSRLEARG